MTVPTDHVRSQHEIDVMFQHLIFGATTTENLAVQGVTDHSSNRTLGDFTPELFDQVKERLEGVPEDLKFHVTQSRQL